jgi:hypothetical protein
MTLLNLFSSRAHLGSRDVQADDRSIMLMVVLLLGLVFAPVIGLHVAAVAFGPPAAASASSPDNLAHHATPPVRPTRG